METYAWFCTPEHKASSALNQSKGINCIIRSLNMKNEGFLSNFLLLHIQRASCLWLVSPKWTEATEVSLHSATNVSWLQLRARGVNLPWQDCWDGSASTATLAGSVCLAIHTATQLARRGSANQDATKVTARARSSFALCRYGCCILFLFSWERNPTGWERSDGGMEKHAPCAHRLCWSRKCSLAWITVGPGREPALWGETGLLKTRPVETVCALLPLYRCTLEVSRFSPAIATSI